MSKRYPVIKPNKDKSIKVITKTIGTTQGSMLLFTATRSATVFRVLGWLNWIPKAKLGNLSWAIVVVSKGVADPVLTTISGSVADLIGSLEDQVIDFGVMGFALESTEVVNMKIDTKAKRTLKESDKVIMVFKGSVSNLCDLTVALKEFDQF